MTCQDNVHALDSFNTQPPEGGWAYFLLTSCVPFRFNTQPPEGGWGGTTLPFIIRGPVSTHSRPKAAGPSSLVAPLPQPFQHTAARRRLEPLLKALLHQVSQP